MPTTLAFALLVAVMLGWLALPFIPAVRELLHPSDATPLDAVGQDADALTHFADAFRRWFAEQSAASADDPSRLGDGTSVRYLHSAADVTALETATSASANASSSSSTGRESSADAHTIDALVVVDDAVRLADDMAYEREVYARASFAGGARSVYRALLADSDAHIGAGSAVMRWAHADEALTVGDGSSLGTRATSNAEIRLGSGVRFERMFAPRIVVGLDERDMIAPVLDDATHVTPWMLPRGTRMASDTVRIDGDATMPDDAYTSGHIIVTGTFTMGLNCRVDGSVKAHGNIVVGARCVVTGALTARGDVYVEAECRIAGPIIAEEQILVGEDTWVGGPTRPSTITAPRVELAHGVTVYGAVHAGVAGFTSE